MDARETAGLYQRLGGVVLRRAKEILGDSAAAEDAVQEVFARVLKSRERVEDLVSPVAWLYQMTTRICLNSLRNVNRRSELDAQHGPHEESAHELNSDARLTVWQLLAGVSDELKELAVYYYVDQMSHDEIAELTGVSRRTVGNRLNEFRSQARAADIALPEEAIL